MTIPALDGVGNAAEIVSAISIAALKLTAIHRTLGTRLTANHSDIPLFQDSFDLLAGVVNEAVLAYFDVLAKAPKTATEVEGWADSPVCDVFVRNRAGDQLEVEIFLRLA